MTYFARVFRVAASIAATGPVACVALVPLGNADTSKLDSSRYLIPPDIGDCKCLNWNAVYEQGMVKCGAGAEYYTYTHVVGQRMPKDKKVCKGPNAVYPKFNHNLCVKTRQTETMTTPRDDDPSVEAKNWNDKPLWFAKSSWCYVSPKCDNLRAGQPINANVSVKTCWEGEDLMFYDMSPPELYKWVAANFDEDIITKTFTQIINMVYDSKLRSGIWTDMYVPESEIVVTEDMLMKRDGLYLDTWGEGGVPYVVCWSNAVDRNDPYEHCGPGEKWIVEAHGDVWCVDCGMCRVDGKGNAYGCLGKPKDYGPGKYARHGTYDPVIPPRS